MPTEAKEYLGCVIGNFHIGIPVESVVEVFETTMITRLPGYPEVFLGMINVRGNIIPLLDLWRASPASGIIRAVVLATAEGGVGIRIDELMDLMYLSEAESPGSATESLKPWGAHFARSGGGDRSWHLMNVPSLITATCGDDNGKGPS
jgi:chemotaxis signal transduction protein